MSFVLGPKSAEGASFSSRGRKAVDKKPRNEIEARRAGILLRCDPGPNAAPSALNRFMFRLSTGSRPRLFNDGPSDLTLAPCPAHLFERSESSTFKRFRVHYIKLSSHRSEV